MDLSHQVFGSLPKTQADRIWAFPLCPYSLPSDSPSLTVSPGFGLLTPQAKKSLTGFPATLIVPGSRLTDAKKENSFCRTVCVDSLQESSWFCLPGSVPLCDCFFVLCPRVYGCYLQEGQSNKIFHSHYQKPVLHIS